MKLKRWIGMLLLSTMIFSGGCGGKTTQNESPENKEKTTLIFEIDEGLGVSELTTIYGSDRAALDRALYNISDGLSPLKSKYDVTVLIYPTWHYYAEGFNGQDPSEPLNRISDDLKYVLGFFEEQDIGVYLELVSSGIDTSQNGEVLDLNKRAKPLPALHYGGEEKYEGLSMDMETLAALYRAYPSFVGVRFHELIGSHDLGLAGKNHGFVVYEEMLKGIFDCVKETGMKLVWGDHSWNTVVEKDGTPTEGREYWTRWLDLCIDTVGTENLTLNFSNNGWPVGQYVNDAFRFKNYRGANYGESVQSWFWQELDCGTMRWRPNGTGDLQTKWYTHAQNDCPIELVGAFSLRALKQGAKVIQYEHPQYFFNYNAVGSDAEGVHRPIDYAGYYETTPDYSLRLRTKRLIEMLLQPESKDNPSSVLTDYFADNLSDINDYNVANENAKRYYQTILTGVGSDLRVFDTFNSAKGVFEEHSENRYLPSIFDGAAWVVRFNLTFSATDEFLLLKEVEGGYVGEFYNYYNGLIQTDLYTFKDNDKGRVVGVIPVNFLSTYENSLEGDPDDMILVRKKDGELSYTAYRTAGGAAPSGRYAFTFVESTGAEEFLQGAPKAMNGYVGSVSFRRGNAMKIDATRPLDAGVLSVVKTSAGVLVQGTIDGAKVSDGIDLDGAEVLFAAAGDINADYVDELLLLVKEGKETKVLCYGLTGDQFTLKPNGEISLGTSDVRYIFTTAVKTYLKKY